MKQKMTKSIAKMKNGQAGTVVSIDGCIGMTKKLDSLGVRKGVKINKKTSLMGCGPVVVSVGTGEVAMGYKMASGIMVEVED